MYNLIGGKGMKGDKEERNRGNVYVRWGHDQCPSTAQLVYSGRVGGSPYSHAGGGSNAQCLPLDPNFLTSISAGTQYRSYIYGAEYYTHGDNKDPVKGVHGTDVPCAVCHVGNRTALYMIPAKFTCPSGWTREYYGYLMTEHYANKGRYEFICIDTAFKSALGSSSHLDGVNLHFVEGRCGTLPCPPYDNTNELSCAVCTKWCTE